MNSFVFQRFDQSVDHPDRRRFRQLIETISMCSNDCEERNYTLGRDANTLCESIRQLRELLVSIKRKLIRQTTFSHPMSHFFCRKVNEYEEIQAYFPSNKVIIDIFPVSF